jgi:hypothetical protein
MRIVGIQYRRFRAFKKLSLRPDGHVILLGPPRSGRSAVLEGLTRVLDPETTRRRSGDEFDFFNGDKDSPAEVELAITDLGSDLEQDFLDSLEVWSGSEQKILTEANSPTEIDKPLCSWALRLTYRLEWSSEDERTDEFVYYSKTSDRDSGIFSRIRPADVERLGFRRVRAFSGKILDLSNRGRFRQLIDSLDESDFNAAVDGYLEAVEASAGSFMGSEQLKAAAKRVLELIAGPLGVDVDRIEDMLRFVPEGGAASGLLRSLMPTLDLSDGAGLLPADRHGSSVGALVRLAEAFSLVESSIVAIDDLGDGLDDASALHMAALAQKLAGQAWITTRNAVAAEIFEPQEVLRISHTGEDRVVHQGKRAVSKTERISAKHWMRSVLPALPFRSMAVVEGPDDLSAVHALSLRLFRENDVPLPGTSGLTFVSAAAAGSGGSTNVPRVTALAKKMGLWTIAIIDWDKDDAQTTLEKALSAADTVVRLPEKWAIERLLVADVGAKILAPIVADLASAVGFHMSKDPSKMTIDELQDTGINLLKAAGGLHSAFLEALPVEALPSGFVGLYEAVLHAAANRTPGHIQL